jgi:hypothetical protein
MKKLSIALLIVVLALCMVMAVACGEPEAPTVTGIAVTTQPTKTVYEEGETFDTTGMVVKKNYSDGTTGVVLDYTVSKTTALTPADTYVTITWGDFTAKVDITVNVEFRMTGVEVKVEDGFKYQPTQSFDGKLQYRATFSDGTYDEWSTVLNDDIVSFQLDGNNVVLDLQFEIRNQTWDAEATIQMESEPISVAELMTKEAGDTVYYVNGYVAAIASTMRSATSVDFFLKDKNSDTLISVLGAASGASADAYGYTADLRGYEMGDELILPVTVSVAGSSWGVEAGLKKYSNYVGGDVFKTAVISKGNNVELDKTNAPEINTQEQLVQYLMENRGDKFYKVVRFRADFNFVMYGLAGGRHYRFYFDDAISANAGQYVDGASPVFMDCNQYYTTGKKMSELLAPYGITDFTVADDYANPQEALLDIYALYAGGNKYYHEFVILDADDVKAAEPKVTGYELTLPNRLQYAKGNQLSVEGAKITIKWDIVADTYVEVTADMLTSTPDMNQLGTHVVTGKYNDYEFNFDVTVVDDAVETITVNTMPTNTTYGHRDRVGSVDVTGGKIDLHFASGKVETIDMTSDMLPAEDTNWKVGVVEYACLYQGVSFALPITFENKALTITQFLSADTAVGTYDLTGIVVGPVNTAYRAELLLKEKDSMTFFSVGDVGIIGDFNAIKLDTTVVNVGDEIILQATKSLATATNGGRYGRTEAGAGKLANFKANLIIVSTDNALNYDLTNHTTISSQAELLQFASSTERHWKLVKFTADLKAVMGSSGWKLFFGDLTSDAEIKVNGVPAWISNLNSNWYITGGINQYFTAFAKNNDYANPSTTTKQIYALCVGGNGNLHSFAVIDDSWIV